MPRLIFLFISFSTLTLAQYNKTLLFIGSYTGGNPASGIYVYEFDPENGALEKLSQVDSIINPSFLNVSSNGKFLYACTESKLPKHGAIVSYGIDSIHGKLNLISRTGSMGENPVYITAINNNAFLINANYTGGNISIHKLGADGTLDKGSVISFSGGSINKQRQESAHPHAVVLSPDEKFCFVPDLGSDTIRVFELVKNKIELLKERHDLSIRTPDGSGPRHLVFHPDGKFVYCTAELDGNILVYSYQNDQLNFIQTLSSYEKNEPYYSTADIHISPDGKFLYASNRGEENSISIFSVEADGRLKKLGKHDTGGKHPRYFNIDPSGKFLVVANLETGNVVVFKRNADTGLLTKTEHEIKLNSPSCIRFKNYNSK